MLTLGASVNVYMAAGGTSFGCTAGANHDGTYRPTITSYDYDAPLDEAGRLTPKAAAYREVIARHRPLPDGPPPGAPRLLAPTRVRLDDFVPLRDSFDRLATVRREASSPLTFEELGISHGVVRYRTTLSGPREAGELRLPGLADRAHVYADGDLLAVVERDGTQRVELAVGTGGVDLEIWVESMGRVNYGSWLGERKGLVGGVQHHQQAVHGWAIDAISFGLMPEVPHVPWTTGSSPAAVGPGWRRGAFEVAEPGSAFLALPGWGKGYVWVNGFCLGRYWDRGPQVTLHLPAPVLRVGANEIVVLELDGVASPVVALRDEPELGPLAPG